MEKGSVKDNMKLKTVNLVWRSVCSQASSHQEAQDVKAVPIDGMQVQEVDRIVQNVNLEVESGNELTNGVLVSEVSQSNVEEGALGSGSMPSAGKHKHSIKVGASLFRFIKGKSGSTQKLIEEEMQVKIIIPPSKMEESVTIEGISAESVHRASERIQAIVNEAVKSPSFDYSHFVSIPLAIYPELVDKLVNFQNSILGSNGSNENTADDENEDQDKGKGIAVELKVEDVKGVHVDIRHIPLTYYPPKASKTSGITGLMDQSVNRMRNAFLKISHNIDVTLAKSQYKNYLADLGIEKSIFIKPKTFHLTVLMLKLWNKDRVDAATEVLRDVSSKVKDALDGRPIYVRLKGLDYMRGSLNKARVLYAPVEEIGNENRLIRACQVIIEAYVEAGLVLEKDATQSLKLHATVMNARHRKRIRGLPKPDYFDARSIMKQYRSEQWGDYLIQEAHLSQRFAFDENGYYHCCASIPFPQNVQVE